MRNSGGRLRQLLNVNNPENRIEYNEEQFERKYTVERHVPFAAQPENGAELSPPGTPTSTSTLQAGGHRLPRPHVSLMRQQKVQSTNSTGFAPQPQAHDTNLIDNPSNEQHLSRHSYYHEGKHSVKTTIKGFHVTSIPNLKAISIDMNIIL